MFKKHNEIISEAFLNTLHADYNEISEKNIGLIALIQPLTISLGLLLAQSKRVLLSEEDYTQVYSISQEILELFVKEAPVVIALLDRNLKYISMSRSWQHNPYLMKSDDHPLHKNYKEVSPYQASTWHKVLQQALNGEVLKHDNDCWVFPDGNARWMRWEVQPWYKDKQHIGGILIYCDDITGHKELEREAGQLLREKNELENFAYMCPHDLQSHIKTLSSFVSFLAKDDKRLKDTEVQKYYKYIFNSLDHMKNLINDCLLHAQLKSEPLVKANHSLTKIVCDILESLKTSIDAKHAKVTCGKLPKIYCHKQTIKQVIENLISNALKFCLKAPEIHVFAEENERECIIHIKDNGIGIKKNDQEKIFDNFYRLHSKDKFPGTGLGLSFCKKIIENHEGHIWITSMPGQGSTFSFSLPKKKNYRVEPGNTTAPTQ